MRVLGSVDSIKLFDSLRTFVDNANKGVRQQGLRWAGDFEGVSDLRYNSANPKKLSEIDFVNWIPGTEYLQEVAKSFSIRNAGRVRMLMMPPRTSYSFHHDPDLWRVHIPLTTNDSSFVVVDGKLWHMQLGYAYLMQVEFHHLALNAGDSDRIHIVFDWCDNLA